MTLRPWPILVILCAMPFTAPHAEPPRTAQIEIHYLLSYIATSGCSFYRNGSWYDASRAKAHLQAKYNYLAARNLIGSTEDFIEKGATKSSISGQPYRIKCGTGREVASGEWLREVLVRYRTLERTQPLAEPQGPPPSY
jgi:Family of unknown function (DUF5329)